MSYILDALKKADAERERDAAAVPDLYAQADAARGARAAARPARWLLLGLGAGGLVLAALAWRWFGAAPADTAPPAPIAPMAHESAVDRAGQWRRAVGACRRRTRIHGLASVSGLIRAAGRRQSTPSARATSTALRIPSS